MSPSIQYASQLFLSFNKNIILKPTAPFLGLAGNNFRHSSPLNKEHLKKLSQSWEKVFIVPGPLEHSHYGLSKQFDMNECEETLIEEIGVHTNIHYLNQNSINVSNQIQVSGLMKWPLMSECIKYDVIGKYIKPKYKLQCEAWNEEEAEWLHSIIQANSHKKHIIISYMCPAVDGLGLNKNARDYSPYIPLERYEQPIAKWIYGIPQTAFTGYCKHNNTFLACNSKDAKGYYEGMLTHLDP